MPKIVLTCPECGVRFTPAHHRTQFCSAPHQKAYNKRAEREGVAVVALAKAWRAARRSSDSAIKEGGKLAFSQLCTLLDASNSRDREAERLHPTKVFIRRRAANLLNY